MDKISKVNEIEPKIEPKIGSEIGSDIGSEIGSEIGRGIGFQTTSEIEPEDYCAQTMEKSEQLDRSEQLEQLDRSEQQQQSEQSEQIRVSRVSRVWNDHEDIDYSFKKILWIRHAQSVFNAHYEEYIKNPANMENWLRIKDGSNKIVRLGTPLTEKGISQARELGKDVKELGVKFHLTIVSVLKRAHETYSNSGLRDITERVEFTPLCREFMTDPSDAMLGEEYIEEKLEDLISRKEKFLEHLKSKPREQNIIAVVSHSEFIYAATGIWLDNATSVWTRL